MKQTAVEWLAFKFSKSSEDELVGNINIWFGQAIQMEKQQQGYSLDDLKEAFAMGRTNATIKDFNQRFKNK